MAGTCLVLNASYETLCYVEWTRAASMLAMGEASVIESDPDRAIHSQKLTLPWPTVVMLNRYVHVPHVGHGGYDRVDAATRRAVIARDKGRCIFCGQPGATTVDHIFPKSRGGRDTWDNLAAACITCNQKKGDRTPEECGMPLLWPPRAIERLGSVWSGAEKHLAALK